MSAAARRLGRPDAARTVIETLLGEMHVGTVQVHHQKRKRMTELARMS